MLIVSYGVVDCSSDARLNNSFLSCINQNSASAFALKELIKQLRP